MAQNRFSNDMLSPGELVAKPVRQGKDLPPLPKGVPLTTVEARAEAARKALKPEQIAALERMANTPPEQAPREAEAEVVLSAPAEIWTGDTYLLSAVGRFKLPPDLAREALAGRRTLQEDYLTGTPFGSAQGLPGSLSQFMVQVRANELQEKPRVDNSVRYLVRLTPVEEGLGSVRNAISAEARAEATARYRRFRIRLREPTEGTRYLTRVGRTVSFRGEYSLDEGGMPKPAVHWTWRFGDGGTAEGLAATHVYTRPGSYWVVGRAASGGHRLEVWLPVCVLSRFGIWPHYPPPSSGPQWAQGYQAKAPGNWPREGD